MDTYVIEVTEDEMWAVEYALVEYAKNPVSDQHGVLALEVYERIKKIVLERSSERLAEANGKRAAGEMFFDKED